MNNKFLGLILFVFILMIAGCSGDKKGVGMSISPEEAAKLYNGMWEITTSYNCKNSTTKESYPYKNVKIAITEKGCTVQEIDAEGNVVDYSDSAMPAGTSYSEKLTCEIHGDQLALSLQSSYKSESCSWNSSANGQLKPVTTSARSDQQKSKARTEVVDKPADEIEAPDKLSGTYSFNMGNVDGCEAERIQNDDGGNNQAPVCEPENYTLEAVRFVPQESQRAADADEDTVGDADDNCPEDSNSDQADADDDGSGDVCDDDDDGDEVADAEDNCPLDANGDQADRDNDGVGDECDNCPRNRNANQADSDEDGIGDVCEADVAQPIPGRDDVVDVPEACNDDRDCSVPTAHCLLTNRNQAGRCVECTVDNHCQRGQTCSRNNSCIRSWRLPERACERACGEGQFCMFGVCVNRIPGN